MRFCYIGFRSRIPGQPHYSLVLWADDGALLDLSHFYLLWETVSGLQTEGV